MNRALQYIKDIAKMCRIELTLSYRIPFLEFVVSIIFLVSGYSIITVSSTSIAPYLHPNDQTFDWIHVQSLYLDMINGNVMIGYAIAQVNNWFFMSIFGSLFFAFTFAKFFEDGTLKSILTYPVGRTSLLLTKVVLFVFLISISSCTIPLLLIEVWYPSEVIVLSYGIICISMVLSLALVAGVSVLLSVLSRNAAVTTLVSMLLWMIVFLGISSGYDSPYLLMLVNPIRMVYNYILGIYPDMLFGELTIFLLGSVVFLMLLLIAGFIIFRRRDL